MQVHTSGSQKAFAEDAFLKESFAICQDTYLAFRELNFVAKRANEP
jgi:hypothetical protein